MNAAKRDSVAEAVLGEDGIIRNTYRGDQSAETLESLVKQLDKLIVQLRERQKPVLILTDASQIGSVDSGAREKGRIVMGTRDYDKAAVFGLSPMLQVVARLIIKVTGRRQQVRIFDSETEALAWLKS